MKKLIALFSFAILAATGLSYGTHAMEKSAVQAEAKQNGALEIVEASYVCMVNDSLFETVQIPVEVGDKTYYGCCAGCEAALKNDPKSRMAIDPVSNNEVDKATAVIGADKTGKTYYFESEENLMNFSLPTK